jgi:hypothetical protein
MIKMMPTVLPLLIAVSCDYYPNPLDPPPLDPPPLKPPPLNPPLPELLGALVIVLPTLLNMLTKPSDML